MADELPAATQSTPTAKEQTPQAALTSAIAVVSGALLGKHPVLLGVAVGSAPFVSMACFAALRMAAAWYQERKAKNALREEFDAYLETIEKRIKKLPKRSPERAELEADAVQVRRARHAAIMNQLSARAQPVSAPRDSLTQPEQPSLLPTP